MDRTVLLEVLVISVILDPMVIVLREARQIVREDHRTAAEHNGQYALFRRVTTETYITEMINR